MYRSIGKRLLDLVLAFSAVILLSPLMLVLAVVIRLKLGSPIFFCQERPGYRERPFRLVKFRSMTDARDLTGKVLPDSQRLTGFGRLLRTSSLDELPELINVLKGEMSLVGPRPLLTRYLPYYTEDERKRFEMRPGITGWAQIRGRNDASWGQRFADDVWYVTHCSWWLDVKILFCTVIKVLRQDNIRPDTKATMQDLNEERSHGF